MESIGSGLWEAKFRRGIELGQKLTELCGVIASRCLLGLGSRKWTANRHYSIMASKDLERVYVFLCQHLDLVKNAIFRLFLFSIITHVINIIYIACDNKFATKQIGMVFLTKLVIANRISPFHVTQLVAFIFIIHFDGKYIR
jgi:hypothetical protein